MQTLLTVNGQRATKCVASHSHAPAPLRFVWHHVQPHEAGGPTTEANLVELCDSCHYTIHRLLWNLRCNSLGEPVDPDYLTDLKHPPRREQLLLAQQGFAKCLDAGTVDQIPNEG